MQTELKMSRDRWWCAVKSRMRIPPCSGLTSCTFTRDLNLVTFTPNSRVTNLATEFR